MNKIYQFCIMMAFIFQLLVFVSIAEAGGRFHSRSVHQNRTGGTSYSSASGIRGPNGGSVRGRTFSTDGQGNMASGSAGVFHGPGGAFGVRASESTRTASGDVQHNSAMAIAGNAGSVQNQRSFDKNEDGTLAGSSETTINSKNGGSYQGSTSYDSQTGVAHTGTCTDAAGNIIPCPENR